MNTEIVEPQGLDFGPVSLDSNKPIQELGTLALLMALLLVFKWAWKRVM